MSVVAFFANEIWPTVIRVCFLLAPCLFSHGTNGDFSPINFLQTLELRPRLLLTPHLAAPQFFSFRLLCPRVNIESNVHYPVIFLLITGARTPNAESLNF